MQWCTATPLGWLEPYLPVPTCVHIMLVCEALVCPMHACVVTNGLIRPLANMYTYTVVFTVSW